MNMSRESENQFPLHRTNVLFLCDGIGIFFIFISVAHIIKLKSEIYIHVERHHRESFA